MLLPLKSLAEKFWLVLPLLALVAYSLTYFFRWEIGLVKPCANCQYFYFSDRDALEPVLRFVYYPAYRIHYWIQQQQGIPNEVYFKERTFPE
jgi:hypothetical protein